MFGFDNILNRCYRHQVKATLIVNIISFSHGIGLGWFAPTVFKLQSTDSPLRLEITVQQASWIGAMISIGGCIGIVVFGCLFDRIGRKKCIYLLGLPHACFWIAIFFASEVYHLYIARILGGTTGGGMYIVIPIFVAEISDNRIRGTLGSLFCFSLNFGILSGFIISSYIPYLAIPCVVIVLPILYLVLSIHLPDTPQHLLRKGDTDDAENAFKFYKNYQSSTKEDLQNFHADFAKLKSTIQSIGEERTVSVRDFCTKRSLKAIGYGVILMFINMFSGVFAIINYSSTIFAETGSTMDPNKNTIIIGLVQIFGSYCATILVDRYGRKILLLLSTLGMCLGLATIGTYSYLVIHIDLTTVAWLPVLILSFVIFTANIGVVAVTFIVLVEILPSKIRSLGSTFCVFILSIFAGVSLKAFPILVTTIGLSGVMWLCSSVAGIGYLFVLICLSETKGKSLDIDSAYE